MTIRISSELRDQLLALAAASPDREVCGLLFGDDLAITAIRQTVNVSLSPHDSFEIEPAALIAAHRAMREGGPRLVGCYHSHPNGLCRPSLRDLAVMRGGLDTWLILAAGELSLWRFDQNSAAAAAITLSDQ